VVVVDTMQAEVAVQVVIVQVLTQQVVVEVQNLV
jgi:hypothetical protein